MSYINDPLNIYWYYIRDKYERVPSFVGDSRYTSLGMRKTKRKHKRIVIILNNKI